MVVAAKLYFETAPEPAVEGRHGRGAARRPVQAGTTVRDAQAAPIDAEIVDLSVTGCRVILSSDVAPGTAVTIGIAGVGRVAARIVRRDAEGYGCVFDAPLTEATVDTANRSDTVVPFTPLGGALPTPTAAVEPISDIARWPVGWRVVTIVGSAAALWGVVIGAVLVVKASIN